ncbi:predicted protein [Lichtheimia corymbifera JMRC:FSU:9682]|uniref:Uncharacterized protein n=1 Tax=Lichtheimia corymbifera JMRC:FSU:9682 TaxID=1263082 RepID=A0A068SG09_9FUNG|nr:predicted protein [Lichtheimia corymbifera JMRC:FSU:9682]
MSDEEDVMADDDGVSVITKIFRPAWRSKRANEFFERVDAAERQHNVNNRARRQQRIRGNIQIEVVQMLRPSTKMVAQM